MTQSSASVSAALHRLIDEHTGDIDALDWGKIVAHVAKGRVTLTVERSYPPIRLCEEASIIPDN
jgi:hypothetical protein